MTDPATNTGQAAAVPTGQSPQPGQAPQAPQPGSAQPAKEKIRFDGQEVEVDPQIADLWRKRERTFSDGHERVREELHTLRTHVAQLSPPAAPAAPAPNPEVQFWEKPLETVDQRIQAAVREVMGGLTRQQQAQQLWAGFWKKNPDLSNFEEPIQALAAKKANEYRGGKSDTEILEEVASTFRGYFGSIRPATPPNPANEIDGPGNVRTAAAAIAPSGPDFSSLSDFMKAQRAAGKGPFS